MQNNNNNQKRTGGKGRPNRNQNQKSSSQDRQMDSRSVAGSLRGSAKQLYEKYKLLAQEKRATDRLESETLFQYADHYYRIYAEIAATEAAAQVAQERERAKRAEAELERRANTLAQEQAFDDQEFISVHQAAPNNPEQKKAPKARPAVHSKAKTESEAVSQVKPQAKPQVKSQAKQKPQAKPQENSPADPAPVAQELSLDLGTPTAGSNNVAATETVETEAPKKRRGRPAKPKVEASPESNVSSSGEI